MVELVTTHGSSHRNSCKYDNPLVVVVGKV